MPSPVRRDGNDSISRLNVMRLEARILMSAAPLDAHGDVPESKVHAPLGGSTAEGGLDTTPPTAIGFQLRLDGEDANDIVYNLSDYFTDTEDSTLNYSIVGNSNPSLFASTLIGGPNGSLLTLSVAPDATGDAALTIRAMDDAGNFVDDTLNIALLPVNDRPTTRGFHDITVLEDSHATVIDLFDAFDDVEDADRDLTYSITQNTNPDLFSSIVIDAVHGTLTFNHAPNAHGSSVITVRATDRDGAFVEMSTSGADFNIYNNLYGDPGVHYPGLDYQPMVLVTQHLLFPLVNGQYDHSQLREAALRNYMRVHPAEKLLVFNIENEQYYGNTPEGRDRFARIFEIAAEERPDVTFGLYSIMPQRDWWSPTFAARAIEDTARNIGGYFASNYDTFLQNYHAWQNKNDLFANSPVSAEFGGRPLAEMVGVTAPGLYPVARSDAISTRNLVVDVDLDVQHSRLSFHDLVPHDGLRVQAIPTLGGSLPSGLAPHTNYYLVNTEGNGFQLAAAPDGTPIQFAGGAAPTFFLELFSNNYLGYDPSVHYWEDYARENVAEAAQYGHPVIPWLSPSYHGTGINFVDKNFFRLQLDRMFEIADGIGLYNPPTAASTLPQNHAWWEALTEFIDYIHTPTQFTITVLPVNDAPTSSGLPALILPPGTTHTDIDLSSYFTDVDQPSGQLSYSLHGTTVPDAFDQLTLTNGTLHIDHRPGRIGVSFVTIRASDSTGLFAEDQLLVQVGSMPVPAGSYSETGGDGISGPLSQTLFIAHDTDPHALANPVTTALADNRHVIGHWEDQVQVMEYRHVRSVTEDRLAENHVGESHGLQRFGSTASDDLHSTPLTWFELERTSGLFSPALSRRGEIWGFDEDDDRAVVQVGADADHALDSVIAIPLTRHVGPTKPPTPILGRRS